MCTIEGRDAYICKSKCKRVDLWEDDTTWPSLIWRNKATLNVLKVEYQTYFKYSEIS